MKQLNTLESYLEQGFKIERDGKTIILTKDEILELHHLIEVKLGSDAIVSYLCIHDDLKPKEMETLILMISDKRICSEIRQQYLNRVLDNNEEMDVVNEYINTYMDIYFN